MRLRRSSHQAAVAARIVEGRELEGGANPVYRLLGRQPGEFAVYAGDSYDNMSIVATCFGWTDEAEL